MLILVHHPGDVPLGAHDGLELARNIARGSEGSVRIFLMGESVRMAVGRDEVGHDTAAERLLRDLVDRGVPIGVCGDCLEERGIADTGLTPGVRRGSAVDWAAWDQ